MELTVEGIPLDEYIQLKINEALKKVKPPEFEGFVSMKVFCEKSGRSRPVLIKILYKNRERFSIENGGWVHYPNDEDSKWSFNYKKMMEFINGPLYISYLGNKKTNKN